MKKKTWKTGPFIQDNDLEKVLQTDYHYRCEICNYSNMGYHDVDLVVLSGPKTDRQMFINERTKEVSCYECINKEDNFGFNSFEEFRSKKSEWKPLKRPHGEKEEKPIFDATSFGLGESSVVYNDDEWDALEKYNKEMQEEYWEKILEEDGLEKIV